MANKIINSFIMLLMMNVSFSQIIMTNGQYDVSCVNSLTFYDQGGSSGNYSNASFGALTITTNNPSYPISVTFSSMHLEFSYDYLTIYNGPSIASPMVGQYTGTSIPPTFTSTDPTGALTFQFSSDADVNYSGWVATITGGTGNPTLSVITTDETCDYSDDGAIDLQVSNNDGPYTYSWSNGATTEDLSNLSQGVYSVMVTSASNCYGNTIASINEPTPYVVSAAISSGLSIEASNASTFQWINCTTGAEIIGATGQTLIASSNGEYAVIGTSSTGCVDTSNCVLIDYLNSFEQALIKFDLAPNPAHDQLKVNFNETSAVLSIFDAQGKLVQSIPVYPTDEISISDFPSGIYLVELSTKNGKCTKRIIKD